MYVFFILNKVKYAWVDFCLISVAVTSNEKISISWLTGTLIYWSILQYPRLRSVNNVLFTFRKSCLTWDQRRTPAWASSRPTWCPVLAATASSSGRRQSTSSRYISGLAVMFRQCWGKSYSVLVIIYYRQDHWLTMNAFLEDWGPQHLNNWVGENWAWLLTGPQ